VRVYIYISNIIFLQKVSQAKYTLDAPTVLIIIYDIYVTVLHQSLWRFYNFSERVEISTNILVSPNFTPSKKKSSIYRRNHLYD